ncbi:uncharacterized protein N7500_002049 [Penicillium coprophilum]|uniref:uncharacterized protein n=1 Tax=Penicillium coprophilum TaxID=36646 RepID=UPI00239C9BCD|nr:uncharacterized protein N7500_002049 [Penicillium coprophilum]KAJ5174118.1 hypothetical protein N7500_002049 [Penicillium coprophilum]
MERERERKRVLGLSLPTEADRARMVLQSIFEMEQSVEVSLALERKEERLRLQEKRRAAQG